MNSRSNRTDPSVAYKKNKNTLSIKAFLGCSSNLANIQMNVYCALEFFCGIASVRFAHFRWNTLLILQIW
ncbi:TPA: hypothetical protein ACG3E5_003156, partial [Legionella pneumophila]